MIPVFFRFDDVVFFKPAIAAKLIPENPRKTRPLLNYLGSPTIPAKGRDLSESAPISNPGVRAYVRAVRKRTQLIGRVIDTQKLKKLKERETVLIREVKR